MIRSPIKIHGGKSYLVNTIWRMAPRFCSFIDGYGGSGVVGFNCPDGMAQTYVEKHRGRYSVIKAIASYSETLTHDLRQIQYSETVFNGYCQYYSDIMAGEQATTVELAVAYIVVSRMSRGGLGKTFAWSERHRGGQPGEINAWESNIKNIATMHNKCKSWILVHGHFLEQYEILTDDNVGRFIYLDPPYPADVRTTEGEYGDCEMTLSQHENLLTAIAHDTHNKIMISRYPNRMYSDMLSHWRYVEIPIANHAGQTKTKERRVEAFWMNYRE